jgi:hypothetical protein
MGATGSFQKTYPCNDFLTVQRIFTSSIPIASAQYVGKCGNVTNVPHFILGANVYRMKIVKLDSRPYSIGVCPN